MSVARRARRREVRRLLRSRGRSWRGPRARRRTAEALARTAEACNRLLAALPPAPGMLEGRRFVVEWHER